MFIQLGEYFISYCDGSQLEKAINFELIYIPIKLMRGLAYSFTNRAHLEHVPSTENSLYHISAKIAEANNLSPLCCVPVIINCYTNTNRRSNQLQCYCKVTPEP